MKQEEFIQKLKDIDHQAKLNPDEIIEKSIEHNKCDGYPTGHINSIIVMEELAELAQQVSKQLRGWGNPFDLLEELADVAICIKYIQKIYHISDEELEKAIGVKINRLNEFLENNPGISQ